MNLTRNEREILRRENEREVFNMHLNRFIKSVIIAVTISGALVGIAVLITSILTP